MQSIMTNNPWERLSVGDARRVNGSGRFDFFWIVLEDSVPALALKLGTDVLPNNRIPKLRSLDLRYRLLNGVGTGDFSYRPFALRYVCDAVS